MFQHHNTTTKNLALRGEPCEESAAARQNARRVFRINNAFLEIGLRAVTVITDLLSKLGKECGGVEGGGLEFWSVGVGVGVEGGGVETSGAELYLLGRTVTEQGGGREGG